MAQAISQQGQLCYTRSVLCDQHKTDYTGTAILCQAVHRATSAKSNIREEKLFVNKNITYALPAPPPGCLPRKAQRPHSPHSQQRTPQPHPFTPKRKNPCRVRSEPEQLPQQGFPDNSCHRDSHHRRDTQKAHYGRCMTSAPQRAEISSVPSHYRAAGRFERTARDEIYTYGKRMSRTT